MKSQVLWLIDNETDSLAFERLCTSLMYRWGYRRIVPIGKTADRGRDAEATVLLGDSKGSEKVFFQYTLEDRWEAKLRRELEKVRRNGHSISRYVFVTRKTVTGAKRDALTVEIRSKYGWIFEVFDREFLRHVLEEAHPGLAERYLGATEIASGKQFEPLQNLPPIDDIKAEQLWALVYGEPQYEEALVHLRRVVEAPENPEGPPYYAAWAAMAWCSYKRGNYKEALRYIEESLRLNPSDERAMTIKGCILCEHGVESSSRVMILQSSTIFEGLLADASDYYAYYNYANALSGLGDYEAARDAYKESLAFNDNIAETWKNLGSCFYELKDHEEELSCYERALQLNPSLPEAIVSKANTLALVYERYDDALSLLQQALELGEDIGFRWPHVYWWEAFCLMKLHRLEEALQSIQKGLIKAPAHAQLINLKASVLSTLWRQDARHAEDAEMFFRLRVQVDPSEVGSMLELAELALSQNKRDLAYNHLATAISTLSCLHTFSPKDLETYSVEEICSFVQESHKYYSYRRVKPLEFYLQFYPNEEGKYGYRHLWFAFADAFVKLEKTLDRNGRDSTEGLLSFLKEGRSTIIAAIARAAAATAIEHTETTLEQKVNIFSILLLVLPMTALYETSWVCGFLIGTAKADQTTFETANEQFLQENDFSPWREEVTENIMLSINAVWHLFPDKNESITSKME